MAGKPLITLRTLYGEQKERYDVGYDRIDWTADQKPGCPSSPDSVHVYNRKRIDNKAVCRYCGKQYDR